MEIFPVRPEFIHSKGRRERHDEVNSIFLWSAKSAKIDEISYSGLSVSRTSLVNRRTRLFTCTSSLQIKNRVIQKRYDKDSLQNCLFYYKQSTAGRFSIAKSWQFWIRSRKPENWV